MATDEREQIVGQAMTPGTAATPASSAPQGTTPQSLRSPSPAGAGIVRAHSGSTLIQLPTQPVRAGESKEQVSRLDMGGVVLTQANVYLVYWGSAWAQQPIPSADEITGAVRNILAGPYMSALAQYRNVGNGTLYGTTQVTTSDPPPTFSDDDVTTLLKALIAAKTVPGPTEVDQLWYCVVMPPGVASQQSGTIGEHLSPGEDILCGWVMNDGTLNYVTSIFSHELVESCTDPTGTGFQFNAPGHCTVDLFRWCEVGDICEGITGSVNGVVVQAYWSDSDGACVIPGSTSPQ